MAGVYECEIVEKRELAESVFAIAVERGELAARSRAGQFAGINCGGGSLLRRPLSICDARGDTVEFVFEVKGEGTRRLADYPAGGCLDILGPLGNGFDIPDGKILVAGGGVGVPPLLFAACSAPGRVDAVLGFRDSGRIILKDRFEEVCGDVRVTTDDGSYGIAGTISGPLEELLEKGGYEAVLACGPRAMLGAAAALCGRYGVPCQVSVEERMGCGIGACLVCACATVADGGTRMSRVCKDGPVFNATELVWD